MLFPLNSATWYILVEHEELLVKGKVQSVNFVKYDCEDRKRIKLRVDSVELLTRADELMLHREEAISDNCTSYSLFTYYPVHMPE
jgi:hypothetical protein